MKSLSAPVQRQAACPPSDRYCRRHILMVWLAIVNVSRTGPKRIMGTHGGQMRAFRNGIAVRASPVNVSAIGVVTFPDMVVHNNLWPAVLVEIQYLQTTRRLSGQLSS